MTDDDRLRIELVSTVYLLKRFPEARDQESRPASTAQLNDHSTDRQGKNQRPRVSSCALKPLELPNRYGYLLLFRVAHLADL